MKSFGSARFVRSRILTGVLLSLWVIPLVFYRSSPSPIFAAESFITTIGQIESTGSSADWNEFGYSADVATYTLGTSTLGDVRAWIGYSSCPTCGTTQKKQRLVLNNLTVGESYQLNVYPAYVSDTDPYQASVVSGQATVNLGGSKSYTTTGYKKASDVWVLLFTPQTPSVMLELGNNFSTGTHYLYFDAIEAVPYPFGKLSTYENLVKSLDTVNSGDWYKNSVVNVNGNYIWNESYVMQAYIYMYKMTKNTYWLDKLIDHADHVLAQRDSLTNTVDYRGRLAPAWQEKTSKYVWSGFTGAMFLPMVRFANTVISDPSVQSKTAYDGKTYLTKSKDYTDAAAVAFNFHEEDWTQNALTQEGYYIFATDLPTQPINICADLCGKPVAFDMQSLMESMILELGNYYTGAGNTTLATILRRRAMLFAKYFKNNLQLINSSSGSYYQWKFSTYYSVVQDVGHGNFDLQFFYDSYKNGLVFTQTDMQYVANTFDRVLTSSFTVPYTLINGTNLVGVIKPIYFWHYVDQFKGGLWEKSLGYVRLNQLPFLDVVTMGYVNPAWH